LIVMELKDATALLALLAQETRLALVHLLAPSGERGMAAGEIAKALGVASSTLSFHLSALEEGGVLQSARRGRHIIYVVKGEAIRPLVGFLASTCGRDTAATSDIDLTSGLARVSAAGQPGCLPQGCAGN
jgi:DNA-binding transcriptional ArsR family regulator